MCCAPPPPTCTQPQQPHLHVLSTSRPHLNLNTSCTLHDLSTRQGIHFFRDKKDPSRQFLLGLCEGNHCKGGRRGAERGNGRIVVTQLVANGTGGDCAWDVVKTVAIPPAAAFLDYSGMDFRGGRVAIASQEDSALFVGTFDWDALEFVESDDDRVYHFPRNEHCEMVRVFARDWLCVCGGV